MKKHKDFVRIARLVLQEIQILQKDCMSQSDSKVSSLSNRVTRILTGIHRHNLAFNKNWMAATKKVQTQLLQNIQDISHEFQSVRIQLGKQFPPLPSLADIIAELFQLEEEYDSIGYNDQERTLSVFTDNIELEDVYLGNFEIKLHLLRMGDLYKDSPYSIIALDPHPAGTDSTVTHPHVSGERLCEGDGHLPIQKALEQGRLCDFFNLVNSILNTYSSDSPYIPLNDWDGYSCYDCGYTINRDESYFCETCENDFCGQCSTYCQVCEITVCLACSTECPGCQRPICRNCYATCIECSEQLCKDCINENGLCNSCEEERKENEDEDEQTDSTAA